MTCTSLWAWLATTPRPAAVDAVLDRAGLHLWLLLTDDWACLLGLMMET